MTVFPNPAFALKPDTQTRRYANVSNSLNIFYGGREYTRLIQVGTALFPIMRLLRITPEDQVSLYLDEDARKMVFGLIINEERIIDLWHYTMDRVPPFIRKPD